MIKDLLCDKAPSHSGILAGIAKGLYWLNDNSNPTIAVVYSYCVGGCGILGEVTGEKGREDLEGFLKNIVFPELKTRGINEFEFSTENQDIAKQIISIFSDRKIESEDEYSYRRDQKIEEIQQVSDEYQIVEVDRMFLNQLETNAYVNSDMLTERLENSWDSYDKFLENSKAYVALQDNVIVGICFGSARYGQYIDIDIETCKEHRNKGIAKRMVVAFVNGCIEKGYVAQWDCVDSNIASKSVAAKCGFQLFKVRPYFWFGIE